MRQRTGTAAAAAVAARVAAVGVVVLLGVAGCGAGRSGGSGLPTVTGPTGPATTTASTDAATAGSSTAAPSGASPDPSPWTALPTISSGPNQGVHDGIVLASSVATTDEEKAAVDAYVAFWKTLAQIGSRAKVDRAALLRVADGPAAADIEAYAKALRTRGARTIGWSSINVTSVSASGTGAYIWACVDDGSFDIDRASGRALEDPSPGYDAQAGLEKRSGGRWVVVFSQTPDRTTRCP